MARKSIHLDPISTSGILPAIYRPAIMPEHADNCLIEALPPFQFANDMVEKFGRYPLISATERSRSSSYRILALSRIDNYLLPLPSHFDVFEKIGHIVRVGYTYRNPASPDTHKSKIEFYRKSMDGEICQIENSSPSTAPSFSLFGISGIGKSTVVERALSFLPQVLHHEKYGFVQVVWMKLDCPPDGSLKQLLLSILDSFDNLLGTPYRATFNNKVIDTLILVVAKLAVMHNLGMLVIDESQNLLVASGVGQKKMLNFFLTFANVVKIPLVTVGTPLALELLNKELRTARRVGDHGTFLWNNLPVGKEWTYFTKNLWTYQWTTEYLPFDKVFSELLYEKTQGIPALTVRLFQLAQIEAIRHNISTITQKLISDVASERFKIVQPILDYLISRNLGKEKGFKISGGKDNKTAGRNDNKKTTKIYEDLFSDNLTDLKYAVENEIKVSTLEAHSENKHHVEFERTRTVSILLSMEFDEGHAEELVDGLFAADPDMTSKKALQEILNSQEQVTGNNSESEIQSMKSIIDAGAELGESPFSALTAAGIMAPLPKAS